MKFLYPLKNLTTMKIDGPAKYFINAKKKKVGGIKVAEHHSNLIHNFSKGKASDIEKLAKILKMKLKKRFGVELEEEVQYLGP